MSRQRTKIQCTYEPGFYASAEYRTWGGWIFHTKGRRPLHDATGNEFRWNVEKGRPEPKPIRLPVSGGEGADASAADQAEADYEEGYEEDRNDWRWHVPTPADRQPEISNEDRERLEEADVAELKLILGEEPPDA